MRNPFGNKVKILRAEHHLSQTALGELIKVSPQFISLLERGERNPSDTTLKSLSGFFKIDKEELLALREERMEYPNITEQSVEDKLPTHIQEFVDILLTIEEEDCKQIVNDLLKDINERFYNLLKRFEYREVKQEALKIRTNWSNLDLSDSGKQENEVNIIGCIQLDKPLYFSLKQRNNVLQLSLLSNDFSQVKIFEEWLDQYQVSYSAEEIVPHMSSKQKLQQFIWFSPFLSSFDKYNYLTSKGIELTEIVCNDTQLNWIIQAKNLNQVNNQELA